MLLDRLDDISKTELIAKVFCAHILGEITYDEFLRISVGIERAFIQDIYDLLEYFSLEAIDPPASRRRNHTTKNVYTSGFSNFYVLTQKQAERSGLEHLQIYHFNRNTTQFARIILGGRFHGDRWWG